MQKNLGQYHPETCSASHTNTSVFFLWGKMASEDLWLKTEQEGIEKYNFHNVKTTTKKQF